MAGSTAISYIERVAPRNSNRSPMRVAVILAAHGEAEGAGFLENYSMIRHTLDHASEVMDLPVAVRIAASVAGGFRNALSFASSGYRSPQNPITRRQAALLGERLASSAGADYEVFPAFHATPPFVSEVLDLTREYDLRLLVSMSPVDNRLTSGALHMLAEACRGKGEGSVPAVIDGFCRDRALGRVYAEHLFRHGRNEAGTALLLAFHGTLVRDARGKEPDFHTGAEGISLMGGWLADALGADPRNAYGSISTTHYNHSMGGRWTRPSLGESLRELRSQGFERADVFGCGYFSDGTETLRNAAREARGTGLDDVRFIPCINEDGGFADYLASRVESAVEALR